MSAFTPDFQAQLADLMRWRRDVRRFRTDPVDEAALTRCLDAFNLAPSVGLSEPWRLMRVDSNAARAAALANFEAANADALAGYNGERAALYAGLKLSGMRDAPVHLAIWCDESTDKGAGVGWVSILDPARLARDLDAQQDWHLIAYLCIGWPEADSLTPELETAGWETRAPSLPVLRR
ncbi:nitroreductase family protein [Roseovarius sp. M141]|uniref:nitroreductase family protein n=1 Tax=Roseovarius sp. M141 TaxID=2583806 RepID=UPI0020CE7798|nr:nitroreductase family protein [Roseovarius sp. M141]MCQ0091155.1 5,6-dimethylbenzimidazole synthase [Roseovarius sp. M141]